MYKRQDKEHRINLAGKSKQELLDILFEERGYEFMDEMQRWFDILRFDKGTEILGNKGWTEKFRYFPIDQSEMDRAKGEMCIRDRPDRDIGFQNRHNSPLYFHPPTCYEEAISVIPLLQQKGPKYLEYVLYLI